MQNYNPSDEIINRVYRFVHTHATRSHMHVKDPWVHVRVRCIMETTPPQKKKKKLACSVGWEARLCRCWLSPGKTTRISLGTDLNGTINL